MHSTSIETPYTKATAIHFLDKLDLYKLVITNIQIILATKVKSELWQNKYTLVVII